MVPLSEWSHLSGVPVKGSFFAFLLVGTFQGENVLIESEIA